MHCTTIVYYPISKNWNEIENYFYSLASINLQILGEENWHNQKITEYQMRFLYTEYNAPTYDSLKLYSLSILNQKVIKLVKKEMLFVEDIDFLLDSTSCLKILNYKETEFIRDIQ